MEFHPVSNLFPMMNPDEFKALVDDIRQNGQREDVWLHEGQIIDGRNRFKACTELGITPRTRTWHGDGSLVQFVVSLNLHRRHLSASQKAMVAVEILPMLEIEAKKRQLSTLKQNATDSQKIDQRFGKATEQAADIVGTNRQYVSDAKRIAEQAPELKPLVLSGELNIPEAKVIAALPIEERSEAVANKMAVHYSSDRMDWATPQRFFDRLNSEFMFDIDVCATPTTAKCSVFFTPETDGLAQTWTGACWMNPPYGNEIGDWMRKAYEESRNGTVVVCLVPSRTDTAWWHDWAMKAAEIRLVRGRLHFGGADNSAPFPSAVVILRPESEGPPVVSGVKASD